MDGLAYSYLNKRYDKYTREVHTSIYGSTRPRGDGMRCVCRAYVVWVASQEMTDNKG